MVHLAGGTRAGINRTDNSREIGKYRKAKHGQSTLTLVIVRMVRTRVRWPMAIMIMFPTIGREPVRTTSKSTEMQMIILDGHSVEVSELNTEPDLRKIIQWEIYRSNAGLYNEDVAKMYREALRYLKFYNWCGEITESYVGMIFEGIIGIFLFRFVPNRKDVDEWVWVVVGDLPPTYLTVDECPNPGAALDGYIGAMMEWVIAAEEGRSVVDLIPVNVPATPETAKKLRSRLEFLDKKILSKYYEDDL